MEKLAVSVVEAAKALGLSKSTTYSLIEQGVIPAVRVGKKRLIVPVRQLAEWLNRQAQGGAL